MKPLKTTLAALSILCANALGQTSNTSPTADYLLDLSWKDLKFTNVMALAENAVVEVRGIDAASSASSLWYYLSARDGTALAITTNVVASTNANAAIGYLNLATTNLQAQFAGANPIAEKNFVFSVWDTARDVLLASALVGVKNNPMANGLISGWTNLPASLTNEFSASVLAAIEYAQDAQAVASNAWDLAYGVANPVADVAYGTATNEAYRGDWGAAVSNAAVLRSIATVPVFDAYSAPASESLPFVVTNTGALTLSGLTDGSIGIRLTTTNASGIALYAAVVKDDVGETIATINPACDGTEQSARWPWNASETLTVEAYGIPSPVEGAESAIITAAQVETWEDISLVGRTNDLADQHTYVDYPAATNEAANRAYADDAADAALALALGEIGTATFNRDLAGYVQRWNTRFDTVADSNSLTTLYGGSTALRLDGEGAAVVPEIRAFAVESGEIATLTVWSYSGGATNLVPEVTTNLITGIWERKPESIVSATNIDAFTAQVVFTNDFERLLYVRLVDVSGGSGVPVFRVFGGIAFGDGEAITDWPQGTITGATINEPNTVATNDGILAFTVTADGSGFPLTNDVSAAGYNVEQVGLLSASSVRAATDVYATNDVSARDLYARRNLDVAGSGTIGGDLVVSGNMTLIGAATNVIWTTVDYRTNVYGGTNYYEENHYRTNYVYQKTIVYTNVITTNNIQTYVNENGTWNTTNAEHVLLPHLRDYRDGNAKAIGTWDFADATVSNLYLQPDAIQTASIAALADGVATIDLGSNWCWRLDASGDITAINFSTAGLKEGAMNANSVKAILLEVSRGESAAWVWGGHLSHITNDAPAAGAVSHLLLIAPSQDVTATNGWTVF